MDFLPNSALSIVQKPDGVDTLTVRARLAGDIEALFPEATVEKDAGTDYRFRTKLPRERVAKAMHDAVMDTNYSNFKTKVLEQDRHDAYLACWGAL